MKKIVFIPALLAFMLALCVNAQDASSTGTPAASYSILENKLEKSNEDTEDVKKNIKSKFWSSRADLMMDIYEVNLQHVFEGSQKISISIIFGKDKEIKTLVKDGKTYETYVYDRIEITFVNNLVTSWVETKKIHEDPLPVANEALVKAIELDIDGKNTKTIKNSYERLKKMLERNGFERFIAGDFSGSYRSFKMITDVNALPVMEGVIDTVIFYNAGMAASRAEMTKESIECFELAAKYNHPEPNTYVLLKQKYYEIGDSVKGIDALSRGFEKYPENQSILVELINYYLANDRAEDALEYLRIAQKDDPTNLSFIFAEGNLYDKMGEREKGLEAYKRCLEQDPNYFNALYNIGISYYNYSASILKDAESIPANKVKEYEAKKAEADEQIKIGLPYMEKALNYASIDSDKASVIDVLKTMYYRLKMMDKFEEMKTLQDKMKTSQGN